MGAPRTPTESLIAEVWCELLGLDAVDVADGFFEVGGQSMIAVQVVYQIERRTGITLDLEALFDLETVAELAAELDRLRALGTAADASAIGEGEL
ncbi:MAG TPA: phosphopantetheine-binding protein [Streptosporangiaceae bacterium]|nr:phosphopantetheine-binding protein [Streptosporangiaceae bacterium]